MPSTSQLDRVTNVVLLYMRPPVFVLVFVYAVGIIGMALIPGRSPDGEVEYMSLFHAFYFFTYTATTTGFGEIPAAFTDEQRLWAILCLYMGVVAWLYAIGSIIKLVQNPHFLQAIDERRFASAVKHKTHPFFIICGFGDTGSLLARGLSDHWLGGVVLDTDPERIKALALRDYNVKMPGLCADPAVPQHLIDAGIQMPNCHAAVILTKKESVNVQIAVMVRLLNPDLPILCLSTQERFREQLQALGKIRIINPFEIFAQLMSTAIATPKLHNLNAFLVRTKTASLGKPLEIPQGKWIICGYGRMGSWLNRYLIQQGIETIIIDPEIAADQTDCEIIRDYANYHTLQEAGIHSAAGVVAGTDNDHDNLSILMCVRELQPDAFTIVRQNRHQNQIAFDAANANLILQSNLTTARRILKYLISPHIQALVDYLGTQSEDITSQLVMRLQQAIGGRPAHLWCVKIDQTSATALNDWLNSNKPICLGTLTRDPHNLAGQLSCVPLVLERQGQRHMLPAADFKLLPGDNVLLCGTGSSETLLSATMNNAYTLHYIVHGSEEPRGYLFRWIEGIKSETSLP